MKRGSPAIDLGSQRRRFRRNSVGVGVSWCGMMYFVGSSEGLSSRSWNATTCSQVIHSTSERPRFRRKPLGVGVLFSGSKPVLVGLYPIALVAQWRHCFEQALRAE